MKKYLTHLKTILKHKYYVFIASCNMGIPLQGILHDLSKFSWAEFKIAKYYNGRVSPHKIIREQFGYSSAWAHHKARNKHHWEYWLDNYRGKFIPIKVPYKYVVEMYCDYIGAGKAYSGKSWTVNMPLDYFLDDLPNITIHEDTKNLLIKLYTKTAESSSLSEFYTWYSKNKKDLEFTYNTGKPRKYFDSIFYA